PISAASTVISQPNIPIFRSIFRRHEGGTLGEGVDAVSPTIFQVLPLALPPETSAELFADTAAMTLDGSTAPLQQAQLATAMLPLLANVAHIAQPIAVNTAVLISAGSQTSSAVAMPVSALLKRSDMRIRRGTEIRIAIPVGAIADQGGEAALLAVAVESAQTVAPFCFVRDTNAYMFVLPGGFTPETKDSLLADAYTHSDGRTVRYYRDEGRKLFYYQPSEFLLARTARPSASAAYQPYLLATMQNIITTGEGQGDAVTDTQVTLTYQLLPSLDPELRELTVADIERKYGETPRLLPIYPGSATVTFGDLPGVPPQTLQADFANGIAGEIELSEDQFKLVMALLTARPDKTAGALSGTVRTTLLDNTPVEVPLRISLVETAGPLFDVLISGLVEGTTDTYQVGLRNRVENPIALNALKQVSVGNQMAYPQAFAPALIGPGQTADVAYKIAPAGEPLRAIDPQLNAQVLIDDYKLLWRKLVVQQGFTSEKFTITVAIQGPEYFASSPDGVAMLTSVLVEFDSGATATLTAEAQSATVELSRGYLAVLIGDFSTYRFRTAANYSTGVIATTEWIATDLDTLAIVPALPAA
ncbi:MAG: hypothetical protein H7Z42_21460, partial [Roseiflexaceae bacterium]|nr:hypothetical protein [Roseiflexaceae bacterium]